MDGGRPFRVTAAATDAYTTGNSGQGGLMQARLVAGGAAAAAQLVDQNGTVLADLAAGANSSDLTPWVVFVGKVRVETLTGAGAIVNVYIQ